MASHLSKTQIEEFYQKGFFVIQRLFNTDEINKIKYCFNRLQSTAQKLRTTQEFEGSQFVVNGDRIDRVVWMGAAEPYLLKFGEDKRLLGPCSELLNVSQFDQLICQGHYKLPGDQVKFDWHQDCQHRGVGSSDWIDVDGRGSYVQTLMAVDEVTAENGPVSFIPYTTHLGPLELEKKSNPTSYFDVNSAVEVLMQPGDVAFFHPYAVHGSQPNNSNRPRRVFINGFAAPGANQKKYPGRGAGRRVELRN